MANDIETIKQIAAPILRAHGVTRSSLFGSHVRGDATASSDVDLLVELPKGTGLYAYMNLKRELESALGRSVDVVTYMSVHPRLAKSIERDLVPVL